MAVMVQEDGDQVLEFEVKVGQSISFRVGGKTAAFMERVGPAPDSDIFMDADGANVEPVHRRIRARPGREREDHLA